MEDLAKRLEKATLTMNRIFSERKTDVSIFRYLGDRDREFSARKMMELHFEKERLHLERQRCNDMLGRYQVLVNLGVELDACMKIEIRQYVSRLSRPEYVPEVQQEPACMGCDNCF